MKKDTLTQSEGVFTGAMPRFSYHGTHNGILMKRMLRYIVLLYSTDYAALSEMRLSAARL